jgi:hypothetical protein
MFQEKYHPNTMLYLIVKKHNGAILLDLFVRLILNNCAVCLESSLETLDFHLLSVPKRVIPQHVCNVMPFPFCVTTR